MRTGGPHCGFPSNRGSGVAAPLSCDQRGGAERSGGQNRPSKGDLLEGEFLLQLPLELVHELHWAVHDRRDDARGLGICRTLVTALHRSIESLRHACTKGSNEHSGGAAPTTSPRLQETTLAGTQ